MADHSKENGRDSFAVTGYHMVAPYEANLVAQANQKRLKAARPVKSVLSEQRSAINRLDHNIRHESCELGAAWEKVRQMYSRPYQPEFTSRTYWSVMLLLAAIEIPLNAAALDFARLAVLETFVVAAGFGLLNFFGAKSFGRVLRQKSIASSAWRDCLVAASIGASLLFALTQFAELRRLDPRVGGSADAFLALQVTFFVVIVAVSYFHVDPDSAREQIHRTIARASARMDSLWKMRVDLAAQYNSRLAECELALEEVMQDLHERIAQYRDGNFLARTDDAPKFMLSAIPASVFPPIILGVPIDPHPRIITEIVTPTWEMEKTQ